MRVYFEIIALVDGNRCKMILRRERLSLWEVEYEVWTWNFHRGIRGVKSIRQKWIKSDSAPSSPQNGIDDWDKMRVVNLGERHVHSAYTQKKLSVNLYEFS